MLFRVRSRIIDVKDLHRYKYGKDTLCRCCGVQDETLNHVLMECSNLDSEPCSENDEFSDELEVLKIVVHRVEEFVTKIDIEEDDEVNY